MNKSSSYDNIDSNAQIIDEVYLRIRKRFQLFVIVDVFLHLSLIVIYWAMHHSDAISNEMNLGLTGSIGVLVRASIILIPPLIIEMLALARRNRTLIWIAIGLNSVSTVLVVIYLSSLTYAWMFAVWMLPFKLFLFFFSIKFIMVVKQKNDLMMYVLTN